MKVNFSIYKGVENTRWTNAYMTGNVAGLEVLGFEDELEIVNAKSGILLEGLTVGSTGRAHINLTLSDGIEYLHISILDSTKTKVAKIAIYYQITGWTTNITLTKVSKSPIDGKMKACLSGSHPDEGKIKSDLQKILTKQFEGCKDM